MGFWPLLIWAIFEYLNFGKSLKNFVFAKFITLLTFCLSVPILFYTYIAILKENYLPIDILIFVVSITLGQLIGYKIMKNKKDLGLNKISIILILLMVLIFSLFYFFTPNNFLFKDPITGNYGITK
jgi:CDP-diglyceride synthetase